MARYACVTKEYNYAWIVSEIIEHEDLTKVFPPSFCANCHECPEEVEPQTWAWNPDTQEFYEFSWPKIGGGNAD